MMIPSKKGQEFFFLLIFKKKSSDFISFINTLYEKVLISLFSAVRLQSVTVNFPKD